MRNGLVVRPIEILLAEDEPGDVRLTREALKDAKVKNELHVVADGVETIAFLRQQGRYADCPRPDLVLLDLNMPRKNGQEVLAEIKADDDLKTIPICVLTSSDAETDVVRSYQLHANCYINKPVDPPQFLKVVKGIEDFWLCIVRLPQSANVLEAV